MPFHHFRGCSLTNPCPTHPHSTEARTQAKAELWESHLAGSQVHSAAGTARAQAQLEARAALLEARQAWEVQHRAELERAVAGAVREAEARVRAECAEEEARRCAAIRREEEEAGRVAAARAVEAARQLAAEEAARAEKVRSAAAAQTLAEVRESHAAALADSARHAEEATQRAAKAAREAGIAEASAAAAKQTAAALQALERDLQEDHARALAARLEAAHVAAQAALAQAVADAVAAERQEARKRQQEATQEAVEQAVGSSRRRETLVVDRRASGGSGVLRFSVRPVRRRDPAVAIVVIEDITQQRVADEAAHEFVAQATHELRTPLTNIRLYLETALDEGDSDPTVRAQCLNVINQENHRLERMVGDLLSVAEIEAGSLQVKHDDVRINQVLHDLEADFQAQAREKRIELRFEIPPKLPVVQADRDKMIMAVHNLIGNALKYTLEGGRVVVRTEADKGEISIEVVDTGIGIGPDDLQCIFDKFYRAQDKRIDGVTGSGLGLALAREIVRLHGGDITVESQLDHGSTFTMTLPVDAGATATALA